MQSSCDSAEVRTATRQDREGAPDMQGPDRGFHPSAREQQRMSAIATSRLPPAFVRLFLKASGGTAGSAGTYPVFTGACMVRAGLSSGLGLVLSGQGRAGLFAGCPCE